MGIFSLPGEAEALLPQLGVEAAEITRVEAMAGGLSGGRVYRLWLRECAWLRTANILVC